MIKILSVLVLAVIATAAVMGVGVVFFPEYHLDVFPVFGGSVVGAFIASALVE